MALHPIRSQAKSSSSYDFKLGHALLGPLRLSMGKIESFCTLGWDKLIGVPVAGAC